MRQTVAEALPLAPGVRFGLNLGCFPGAPEPRVRESWCRFRIIDCFDEETVFEMPVLSPPGQSGADFCLGGRSLPPVGVLVGETYWRCRRGGVEYSSSRVGSMGLSITSTPPLSWVASPAKMFGKCLEHVQNCWVPLSSGWSPRKGSEMFGDVLEMFGNIRKMLGTCSELAWPLHQRPHPGPATPVPNISQHFRRFAGGGRGPPPRGHVDLPIPNIFRTFSECFLNILQETHPGKKQGRRHPQFRTFSQHVPNIPGGTTSRRKVGGASPVSSWWKRYSHRPM